jgi:hypothetical protein
MINSGRRLMWAGSANVKGVMETHASVKGQAGINARGAGRNNSNIFTKRRMKCY